MQKHIQIFYLVIVTLIFSCKTNEKVAHSYYYFPEEIKNIKLGMNISEVQKLRTATYEVNSLVATPELIYTEEFKQKLTTVYYYFSKSTNNKLIKVKIIFRSVESLDNFLANNYKLDSVSKKFIFNIKNQKIFAKKESMSSIIIEQKNEIDTNNE